MTKEKLHAAMQAARAGRRRAKLSAELKTAVSAYCLRQRAAGARWKELATELGVNANQREVRLLVQSLRKARVAESLRISMQQDGRPILEVITWVGNRTEGYEHNDAQMPTVPALDDIASLPKVEGSGGFHTLWQNLEQRPCGTLHWDRVENAVPRQRDWVRLRDFEPSPDAFVDAGRYAMALDMFTWPSAAHAHVGDSRFIAPTLAFGIEFHSRTDSAWLLSDATSPCASGGTI
jgi:acyl-CoA thioesterase